MYKEAISTILIKDRTIQLNQITNIDEVFDALIAMHPEDESYVDERIPYWTELWPSAIALATFIEENPNYLTNKKVIELGCGLGLPSIIAAAHAKSIVMTDYLEDALLYARKNVSLNGLVNVDYQLLDWRNVETGHTRYDVILASDIAYEKRMFESVIHALKTLMHYHSTVIITEPGRAFAQSFVEDLSEYFEVKSFSRKVEWRSSTFTIGLYVLKHK